MTEPDILGRKIDELKESQRVAWRRVADPLLTAFERREIRNHIRDSGAELRGYLGMISERLPFTRAPLSPPATASPSPNSDFWLKRLSGSSGITLQ